MNFMNFIILIFTIFIINSYALENETLLQPSGRLNFNLIDKYYQENIERYIDNESITLNIFHINYNILRYSSIHEKFDNYPFSLYPESYKPDGTIYKDFSLKNPIVTYKSIYKRHTNFAIESSSKVSSNFGKIFIFSPLNDYCNTDYEKNNAKTCLENYPNNWNCIYEYCISLSRTIPYYINITLPSIYYMNNITNKCYIKLSKK